MKMVKKESEYSKKLRDPRWQKKRLGILERDEWACQKCFDTESTLTVHHRRYLKDKEPWDYPDNLLVTLCENCHEHERDTRQEYETTLLEILREKFLADDLFSLVEGFHYVETRYPFEVFADILKWFLENKELVGKVGDLYFEDISKRLHRGKETTPSQE